MKRFLAFSLFAALVIFGSTSHALNGQGTIEEILTCGTGEDGWKEILMYRLSAGNWCGVDTDWAGTDNTNRMLDLESNTSTSLVMMAFTSGIPVQVRATYSTRTGCGHTVYTTWNKKDDYIRLVK